MGQRLTLSTLFDNCTKGVKDDLRHSRGAKTFDSILTTFLPGLKWSAGKKEQGIKTDSIVNMLEIFKPHAECSQPRKVLIEGQPGVGKTTYCNKVAYDWAKNCKADDSFPDVQVLLLLK